jgi:hypothetical protein
MSERWLNSYLSLLDSSAIGKRTLPRDTQSGPLARQLLHNLSRARAQVQQANQWLEPMIGNPEKPTDLARTRGILWKYVIAYSGWENCTSKLSISQKLQEQFFDKSFRLNPPVLRRHQKTSLAKWVGLTIEEFKSQDMQFSLGQINGFLGITSEQYKSFPDWLVGRQNELSQPQILAIMRHMVAHGSLLPNKSQQWGLNSLYENGPIVISHAFQRLLTRLYPFAE